MRTIDKDTLVAVSLCMLMIPSSWAEMRTWTDNNGNKIQADLVENRNGQITLESEAGKPIHISISDLCSDDQKFVLKNSPPKIEISVNEVTDRQNKGFSVPARGDRDNDRDFQIQTSHTYYKATLTKGNSIDYAGKIRAELYIIGQKKLTEEFVLLSKTVKNVVFGQGDEDDDKFVMQSKEITTREVQGGVEAGVDYFGNLVVLVDEKGRVFNSEGSRSKMAEHIAFIRKQKEGAVITKNDLVSAQNSASAE